MKNKKILTYVLMMLLILVSCSSKTEQTQQELVKEDYAKILLANERLDESQLRSEGNLFDSGETAFIQIKESIKKYSNLNSRKIKLNFNKNNNKYTWSDAPEYSNFLSYFYSYSDNIEFSAEKGAELIDITKSSIKVVDSWIKISSEQQILLTVDKDSETIFSRYKDQYEICKRTQNSTGQNVFEMFIANSDTNYKSRMTYIPGMRYEYTAIQNDVMLVIIADKDKGYWDIMSTSYNPEYDQNNYTFSNFVMKDEAIYETTYSIMKYNDEVNEYYGDIKLVSSDGKNDLLSIVNNNINIYTTGINNLECFYIEATEDEVGSSFDNNTDNYKVLYVGDGNDRQYFTNSSNEAIARFINAKELKKGDLINNGEIVVNGNAVNPIGGIDFYGQIELSFNNDDISAMLDGLSRVMDIYGFTFKDDFETIKEAVIFAKQDIKSFGKYYLWQDNHVNDIDGINKAIEIERNLIDNFVKLYDDYKNKKVIKIDNQLSLGKEYYFSNLNIISNGIITNNEKEIIIEDIKIEVLNNELFTNESYYQISFAFAKEIEGSYYNLYSIELGDFTNKIFNESELDNFTLTQSTTIKIPSLEEGDYVLVAYICEADTKIRITNPIGITGTVVNVSNVGDGVTTTLFNNQDNNICLNSVKSSTIILNLNDSYTYNQLYLLLESYAYKYGSSTENFLEKEVDSDWVLVTEDDLIEKGKYRLSYYNTNLEQDGYIIAIIE